MYLQERKKENGDNIQFRSTIDNCNRVSYALLSMGLKKGDKIAIISNNRPEWNFTDFGISQIGAVSVPIYPTISSDEYAYILGHAEPKLIFISDKSLYEKIKPLADKIPAISDIYTFDKIEGVKHFTELITIGKETSLGPGEYTGKSKS